MARGRPRGGGRTQAPEARLSAGPGPPESVRRYVTGGGRFIDDLSPPGTLYLQVVRSIYARARLLKVKGGITADEVKGTLASVGEGAWGASGVVSEPVLASGVVNYVGQPVAAVVGRDRYQAEDLAQGVEVEYEPLKPLMDPEEALRGEPIHAGTRSNAFADAHLGKDFDLPSAPVVVEETLVNERVVPNPMEPRGVLAQFEGGRLTVWASSQSVHSFREGFSESLGLPPESVRVVQMDTGGAFGSKGGIYPEYVMAARAAMKLKRPVKWIETRSEHLVATHQGRGVRGRMKVYADRKGEVQGLKADILVDGGAYSAGMGAFAPAWIGFQLTGPYAIRRALVEGRAVYTNKVPLGPYRGAGRPEAAFFMERMMDVLADELGMDPVDVRLANAGSKSFTSPLGVDVNPFRPFLEAAVAELGYRRRVGRGNAGFSTFVLIPATEPGEGARIAVKDGRIKVWLGGDVHGQGHEAFVRRLLREELGVPEDIVDLERGDTDMLREGVGAWGSRSAIMGGAAVVEAARKLKERVIRKLDRYSAEGLLKVGPDVTVFHKHEESLNSFGANLLTAELDETGRARAVECLAYYDVGRVLNPPMVEGQIIGGSAQAIGQVLFEGAAYGEDGQPLTVSLADAGIPTAAEMPKFTVRLATQPSPLPHGAKGVGESPTIGVPPALVRAVEKLVGKRLTHTPLMPSELRREGTEKPRTRARNAK